MLYVDVILPLPLEGTFTYSLPTVLADKVRMGVRALVPLGKGHERLLLLESLAKYGYS